MTGSNFTIPSSDLRRSATEAKRDHDHKAKWARGVRTPTSKQEDCRFLIGKNPGTYKARPEHPPSHWPNSATHHYQRVVARKATTTPKAQLRYAVNEVREVVDRTASDMESEDYSGMTPPAADDPSVFYSFDAANGPSHGENILSFAIARAMERFETKETEKIEKEYEFVPLEESSLSGDGYTADDYDFEIVDRPSMG